MPTPVSGRTYRSDWSQTAEPRSPPPLTLGTWCYLHCKHAASIASAISAQLSGPFPHTLDTEGNINQAFSSSRGTLPLAISHPAPSCSTDCLCSPATPDSTICLPIKSSSYRIHSNLRSPWTSLSTSDASCKTSRKAPTSRRAARDDMAVAGLQAAVLPLIASQAHWTDTSPDQKAMWLHQSARAAGRVQPLRLQTEPSSEHAGVCVALSTRQLAQALQKSVRTYAQPSSGI